MHGPPGTSSSLDIKTCDRQHWKSAQEFKPAFKIRRTSGGSSGPSGDIQVLHEEDSYRNVKEDRVQYPPGFLFPLAEA